jgi:FtsH-binding integral membrane protein
VIVLGNLFDFLLREGGLVGGDFLFIGIIVITIAIVVAVFCMMKKRE